MHRSFAVALAAALALILGLARCGAAPARPPRPPTGLDDAAAREVLGRFARAVEARRFDEAAALLSARWRAAYTPGRLALDAEGSGGTAREAAARVLAALGAGVPLERGPSSARLPTGAGRGAQVVAEDGGWRVDALE